MNITWSFFYIVSNLKFGNTACAAYIAFELKNQRSLNAANAIQNDKGNYFSSFAPLSNLDQITTLFDSPTYGHLKFVRNVKIEISKYV